MCSVVTAEASLIVMKVLGCDNCFKEIFPLSKDYRVWLAFGKISFIIQPKNYHLLTTRWELLLSREC